MRKIKVFLSDSQIIFREGIHFTLSGEEDFEITGETASNDEALAFLEANPPDVAMLGFNNGKLDGCGITRYIKRNLPLTSVILIMDNRDEAKLLTAVKSGARACIYKDIAPEDLIVIVRDVAQGNQPIIEAMFMPGLASKVSDEFKETSALNEQFGDLLAVLSPAEVNILNRIAEGDTIKQVTEQLNTDETAVRKQLALIISKLVVNDQNKTFFEVALRNLPSLFSTAVTTRRQEGEYVTRKELDNFEKDVIERCKELIDELGLHQRSKRASPAQGDAAA